MEKMHQLYKRLFFCQKSYFILNHLTLHISDDEIRKQYNEELAKNFNKLFKSTMIVLIIYASMRGIAFVVSPSETFSGLFGTFLHLFFVSIWGLLKWRFPVHAPMLVYVYCFTWCLFTNLSWRN